MQNIYVDFKNKGNKVGVHVYFGYDIDGFSDLIEIIKSCGGAWNKKDKRWIVPGDSAFFCVDLLKSLKNFRVVSSDYFNFYLKCEMRILEKKVQESRNVKSGLVVACPDGLSYFSFQKVVVEFFNKRGRSILLADEAGSGKTISSAAIINYHKFDKILVICPDSLKEIWQRELSKWVIKKLGISIIDAVKDAKLGDVMIINYDLLSKYEDLLSNLKFQFMIADEAHMIKTSSAKRTKSLKHIASNIENKIILTGTPVLNRPMELYTVLNLLRGNEFGNKFDYAKRYCAGKIKQYGEKTVLEDKGSSNLDELNYRLRSSVMLRREKIDIINEFPNIRRYVCLVNPNSDTNIDYEIERKRYTKELREIKKQKDQLEYDEYLSQVKRINDFHFETISKIRKELAVSKIEPTYNFVNEMLSTGIKKIVLFAHHREVIEELQRKFGEKSILLYGGISSSKKMKIVDRFEKDDSVSVFIGSIKASGVGFTLTCSSKVVFAELDWTPMIMSQCECRCARLGQKEDVDVYYLIAKNSLDQNIVKKMEEKTKIIDTIML